MFCLSGKDSVISCDFFPAINLSKEEWEIGLIDLSTYNSIPNVEEGINNKIHIVGETIELPTGSYEIEDIANYVKERVKKPEELLIRANNNTLKSEIFSTREIDFTKEKIDSIAPLLGFSRKTLDANKWYESDLPVDILKVNVIRVECNIARGSFDNGTESHILHEFYPTVEPGFKIVEKPNNVIYLPVNVKQLHNITIKLKDQEDRLINLRKETINIRLHLRKHGTSI